MTILMSVLACAMVLAWPTMGEAQGKTAKPRGATATQHHDAQRHAKVRRGTTAKPCAARTWAGCQGWDPDPNVRMMIQMDASRDDL